MTIQLPRRIAIVESFTGKRGQVYTFHKKCIFAKNVKCVDLTPKIRGGCQFIYYLRCNCLSGYGVIG